MATKTEILEATITVFNEKGMKFTMDDLAHSLSISKKTIYVMFPDKKQLFLEMTDYLFDQIRECKRKIYEDESLSTEEKLEKILIAMPERFFTFDFGKITALRESYPEIYEKIGDRLDSGWELTIDLYERAVKEGKAKKKEISVIKAILEGTIGYLLADRNLTGEIYKKTLTETANVIMNGLLV